MKINFYRPSRPMQTAIIGFLFAVAAILPFSLHAQDSSDDWESRLSIYGWLPDINIDTQFPDGSGGPSLEVDAGTLLDNLSFTFQGAFEVSKGSWGAFTDLIYLKETARRSDSRGISIGGTPIPGTVDAKIKYGLETWIVTLAGTYQLQNNSKVSSKLLLGARMFDMDQELNWSFDGDFGSIESPPTSGSRSGAVKNWDAIIGLKGQILLGSDSRWVVPFYADIGTGDSSLTWQAMTGVGYQFNWGTVALNYRYLDYQPASDSKVSDFTMSGPMLGASFTW